MTSIALPTPVLHVCHKGIRLVTYLEILVVAACLALGVAFVVGL
jgi:hypothetical protein